MRGQRSGLQFARRRCRREWGRHARRQEHAQQGVTRPPGIDPRTSAHPTPAGVQRDRAYATGARNVFLWTLAALLLSGFLPGLAGAGTLLLPVLAAEALIWAIYQAQYRAARRRAAKDGRALLTPVPTVTLPPEGVFGFSDLDRDILARHEAQAADRAAEAQQAAEAGRQAEAVYQQILYKQKQESLRLEIAQGVVERDAARQEAARRQAEAREKVRAKAKAQEEARDHELLWLRAMKQGKPLPQETAPGPVPYPAPFPDEVRRQDVERQIQALERKIREGLPAKTETGE